MSPTPHDWLELEKRSKRVLDAADWRALGDVYFHEDGERLWRERRGAVVELGAQLARRLAGELRPGGASLWVGAGVAELPVLLAEVTLLGRTVLACNLIEAECAALGRALATALPDVSLEFRCGDALRLAGEARFDHLGCVSVFTDPERWPTLSDVAYGRVPPVQLDVERFVAERAAARALAEGLFARLEPGACITTTAEEVGWFLAEADARGCAIDASDDLLETAVVGDPVGFLRVLPAGSV